MNDQLSESAKSDDVTTRRRFLRQSTAVAASAALLVPRITSAAEDVIRIGYVSPRTGSFSAFAESDNFIVEQTRKALAGGLTIGGKKYAVEFLVRDDQSSPDRASNLAAELINKHEVDLMLAQGALGVVPVSQQCESNGVPCITTMSPWQAWMFPMKGEPTKGFTNCVHFFWGLEDISDVFLDIWKDLPVRKVVGTAFENTLPGNAMGDLKTGMPAMFTKAGYKIVDVGKFALGTDDFSIYIHAFKKEGVEIVTGVFPPPEWASFMKQAAQMGFRPKVATVAKAFLFPSGVAALGARADGMSTEVWWSPAYPFRSSLTGQTAKELAESYQAATKREWTQPLGVVHALFETGIAALKASGNPKYAAKVADTLRTLKHETVIGRLEFGGSGTKNVSKMRIVGGQWRLNTQNKPELFITHNRMAPEIPVQRKFELLTVA